MPFGEALQRFGRLPPDKGVPDAIVDKLVDNLTMSGDLDDVDQHIETLRHYRDMGVDEVALTPT
jgi:hypothetical protein